MSLTWKTKPSLIFKLVRSRDSTQSSSYFDFILYFLVILFIAFSLTMKMSACLCKPCPACCVYTLRSPNYHFYTHFFNRRDQESNRGGKWWHSKVKSLWSSCRTDTWRPTVLDHFIIVPLMLYSGQAAGECLPFSDPYPIPASLSPPPSSLPLVWAGLDILPVGFELLDSAELIVVKGNGFGLVHLTSVRTFHTSFWQGYRLKQSWARTYGLRTNCIVNRSCGSNDTLSMMGNLMDWSECSILNKTKCNH